MYEQREAELPSRGFFTALASVAFASTAAAGPVLKSYLPYVKTAADWRKIKSSDRWQIAHELKSGYADDGGIMICMDTLSEDIRYEQMPFKKALDACADWAKKQR